MDADLIALEARCHGPERYGDCARFAADYIRERTGDDLLGEWRDAGREDIIARHRSIPRAMLWEMARKPGWARVEPGEASGPCLGLAAVEGRSWAFCVAVGGGWWAARIGEGLTLLPTAEVRRAWCQRQART